MEGRKYDGGEFEGKPTEFEGMVPAGTVVVLTFLRLRP